MKTILISFILTLFSNCNEIPNVGKLEVKQSIYTLFEKNILESSDTLFIDLTNITIEQDSLKYIDISSDITHLDYTKKGKPFIILSQTPSSKFENRVLVKFKVEGQGGYSFKGEIAFDYIHNKFIYKSCHYVSFIN